MKTADNAELTTHAEETQRAIDAGINPNAHRLARIDTRQLEREYAPPAFKRSMKVTIDIETVPLPGEYLLQFEKAFPRVPDKPHDLDAPALHWTTGRIACFGIKFNDSDPICIIKQDERDLLLEAWEVLNSEDIRTVKFITFNGKKFDFPFIINRANALETPFSLTTDWKRHIDLFDHPYIGGKWGATVPSLARMAFAYGVHDSLYGSGEDCEEWWMRKEWSEIGKHNAGDLNATYRIFSRGSVW